MHPFDRSTPCCSFRNATRASVSVSLALAVVAMIGCVHEKGDAQLVWLQTGLDSEFPDRGGPMEVTAAAMPTRVHEEPVVVTAPQLAPTAAANHEASPPAAVAVQDLTASVDDPGSPTARPVIRIVGSGRPHAPGHAADDHIEISVPGVAVTSAK